jgi:methionyl aminopeptidase
MNIQKLSILTKKEIKHMRIVCKMTARLLHHLSKMVAPGISTLEINNEAEKWVKKNKAINAPLGYCGYPKSICTSINEVICHGIPSSKSILKEGDIINIDVSLKFKNYYGDTSKTFFVGNVSKKAKKIVNVAEKCLNLAIKEISPGKKIGDLGYIIQEYAKMNNFSIVKEFVGHGIGKSFHMLPQIPHFGNKNEGIKLTKGMTFTIEPMINEGTSKSKILNDCWTAVTFDGKLSAQFEHTITINDSNAEILTIY